MEPCTVVGRLQNTHYKIHTAPNTPGNPPPSILIILRIRIHQRPKRIRHHLPFLPSHTRNRSTCCPSRGTSSRCPSSCLAHFAPRFGILPILLTKRLQDPRVDPWNRRALLGQSVTDVSPDSLALVWGQTIQVHPAAQGFARGRHLVHLGVAAFLGSQPILPGRRVSLMKRASCLVGLRRRGWLGGHLGGRGCGH